ncbi:TPA: protein YsgD, partial [Escherichia coli]
SRYWLTILSSRINS